MALKEISKDDGNIKDLKGILLNLDNGDLVALDEAVKKWGFKNKENALRFALAVIAQSESKTVYVEKSGNKVGLKPNQELLKEEEKKPVEPTSSDE